MPGGRRESSIASNLAAAADSLDFPVVLQTLSLQLIVAISIALAVPGTADSVAIGFAMAVTLYSLLVRSRRAIAWASLVCNITMALLPTAKYAAGLAMWGFLVVWHLLNNRRPPKL